MLFYALKRKLKNGYYRAPFFNFKLVGATKIFFPLCFLLPLLLSDSLEQTAKKGGDDQLEGNYFIFGHTKNSIQFHVFVNT